MSPTIDEGLRYQRTIPEDKNFAKAMAKAKAAGRTLLQPRAGVALIDEHIRLLRLPRDRGRRRPAADHHRRLHAAEPLRGGRQGHREIDDRRHSLLNGFPAVNHGVERLPHGDRGRRASRSRSATARPTRGSWPRSRWPAASPASRAAASPTTSPTPRTSPLDKSPARLAVRRPPVRATTRRTASPSTASRSARSPARSSRPASATPSPSSRACWPWSRA